MPAKYTITSAADPHWNALRKPDGRFSNSCVHHRCDVYDKTERAFNRQTVMENSLTLLRGGPFHVLSLAFPPPGHRQHVANLLHGGSQ